MPRFRHTRPEALALPEPPRSGRGNARSRRLAAFLVPPLALEDDPGSLRPFAAAAPTPTASLVCSCLPCAAPWRDRKYITGYRSSRGCRRDVSIGRWGRLRQFDIYALRLGSLPTGDVTRDDVSFGRERIEIPESRALLDPLWTTSSAGESSLLFHDRTDRYAYVYKERKLRDVTGDNALRESTSHGSIYKSAVTSTALDEELARKSNR